MQDVLRAFERNLMFERKEGKVYAADELAEASAALMSTRHAEMRDAGKEIIKLLSASNRVVKVRCQALTGFDFFTWLWTCVSSAECEQQHLIPVCSW